MFVDIRTMVCNKKVSMLINFYRCRLIMVAEERVWIMAQISTSKVYPKQPGFVQLHTFSRVSMLQADKRSRSNIFSGRQSTSVTIETTSRRSGPERLSIITRRTDGRSVAFNHHQQRTVAIHLRHRLLDLTNLLKNIRQHSTPLKTAKVFTM